MHPFATALKSSTTPLRLPLTLLVAAGAMLSPGALADTPSVYVGPQRGVIYYYQDLVGPATDAPMQTAMYGNTSVMARLEAMADNYNRFFSAVSGGKIEFDFDILNLAIDRTNPANLTTPGQWGLEEAINAFIPAGYSHSNYTFITPIYSPSIDKSLVNTVAGVGTLRGTSSPSTQTWAYIGGIDASNGYYLHEMGHNLGFGHSGAINYDGAPAPYRYNYDYATKQYTAVLNSQANSGGDLPLLTIGGTRISEYAGKYSLMATGGGISPRFKQAVGWMDIARFASINKTVAPGTTQTMRLYDDMLDRNLVVTGTGTGVDKHYTSNGYTYGIHDASLVRQGQTFHVNADNITGKWTSYIQKLDFYYRKAGETYPGMESPISTPEGIVVELNGNYVGFIGLGQTLSEKDFNTALFLPYMTAMGSGSRNQDDGSAISAAASKDILTYNGGNPGGPRNPANYRSRWYTITFNGAGVDTNGHWADIVVQSFSGADIYGMQWDADAATPGVQDGSGTWTSTGGNWRNVSAGTDNQIWTDGLAATFGGGASGAAGTTTIVGTVAADALLVKPAAGGGTFTFTGGTLSLGAGGLNAEADVNFLSTLNFSENQVWEIADGKTVTINGTITNADAKALHKMGFGDLALNTANTWTGNLNIVEGRVIQRANQTFSGKNLFLHEDTAYDIESGTLALTGNAKLDATLLNTNARVRLNSGSTSTALAPDISFAGQTHRTDIEVGSGTHYIGASADTSLNGRLTGTGTLALNLTSDTRQFTLNGNNTHTGDIRLERGTLVLGNDGHLSGQNRVTFDVAAGQSAQLRTGANSQTIRDLANTGAGSASIGNYSSTAATLTVNQTTAGTFSGLISNGASGSLALTKTGAATLSLTAANTYTGGMTIQQGTLRVTGHSLATGGALGTGTLVMAGGKLTVDQTAGLSLTRIAGATLDTSAVSGGTYTNDLSPLHLSSGSPISNSTYAYTGKIYLTAGDWAFGENFDDAAYLKINGATILNNSSWNTPTYGGITIATTGWYDIDLRVQNGGGGVGGVTANGWGSTKGIGIKQGTVVTGTNAGDSYTAFDVGVLGTSLMDTLVIANAVRLDTDATFEIANTTISGAETKLTGAITGVGALIKTGGGTLTLAGPAKTYTGATRVNEGVLATAGANILPSATTVVLANTAGVALDLRGNDQTIGSLAGGGSLGGGITLGTARLTTGADNTSTAYAGVISGTGGLTKTGSGTLTLSGQNTYTGGTRVAGGALALDFSAAGAPTSAIIGAASALTLDNGRIEITGKSGANLTQTFAGLTLAGEANTLRLNRNGATSLDVDIGAITRTGAATINFDGITGTAAGARVLTSSGTANQLLDGGARWAMVNGADWAAKDASNTYVVAYTGYADITTNGGVIPNSSAANVRINEAGGGTVALAATPTTAVTSVLMAAGTTDTVVSMASRTLDTAAVAVGANAAKLTLGATPGQGVLTASGNSLTLLANNAAAARGLTVNAVIADAGATPLDLTVSGGAAGGTVILAGDNTYKGATTIIGGAHLRVGAGGASGTLGSGAVTLAAGSDITFHRTDSTTVANAIHGAGNLIREGVGGTTILTGTSDYTGGTTVTSGTLQIGSGTSGAVTGTSGFTVASGATLAFGRSDTTTIATSITGSGDLLALGGGTTVLTGANTYAGATHIQSGTTLQVGSGGTAGTLGTGVIITDGTLALNRSDTVTLANAVSGAGTLIQTGTGTTILTGSNSQTATRIDAGTLQVGNGGTTGTLGGAVLNNAALVINRADAVTLGNAITGTGTLAFIGDGVATITATNGYTGQTTIAENAAVRLSGAGTLGTTGAITNLGRLSADTAGAITLANAISGRGDLSVDGTGTLTLTATSTYYGDTTVNSGTLRLGSGGTSGSIRQSTVTLAAGGTLEINRTGACADLFASLRSATTGAGTVRLTGDSSTVLTLDTGSFGNYSGTVDIGASTRLALNATGNTTIANALTNNGTLAFNGTGQTTFTGTIAGAGGLVIESGTLAINSTTSANAFGGTPIRIDGGKLAFTGNDYGNYTLNQAVTMNGGSVSSAGWFTRFTLAGPVDIAAGGAKFISSTTDGGNGGEVILNGLVTGSGEITLDNNFASYGLGRIYFNNAANTYSGTVTFAGMRSKTVTTQSPILAIGATTALRYATLNLSPIDAADTNRNQVYFSSGVTAATVAGLTGNAYGGMKLQNINNNALALTVNNTAANTFAGILSGTGSLTKTGAGTLTLSGQNTYTGATAVNAGTLALDFSASGAPTTNILAAGTALQLGGGTLRITGATGGSVTQTFASLTTTAGASRFELSQNGATSLDVNVGALTFGGGTVDFAGLSGTTAGARVITTTSAGANDSRTQLSGTSAFWNGTGWASVQDVAGTKYLVAWTGTNTDVFTGTATGGSTVIPSASGTNIFLKEGGSTGAPNTLAAATTTIDSLLMQATATDATVRFNTGEKLIVGVGAGGTGNLAIAATGRSLTLGESAGQGILTTGTTGAGTLSLTSLSSTAKLRLNAVIADNAGAVSLIAGNGVELAADNTYTGTTTVTAGGTLRVGVGGATGTLGSGAVTNNGSLRFDRSTDYTLANNISGGGALTKAGAGTLTITGATTYTGSTAVTAGKLQINSNSGTLAGTSDITIHDGATLEFMGGTNTNPLGNSNKAIAVATGGTLLVSRANAMGYSTQGNMANVTLNGGTFTLNADQYINNLTLGATGSTVNGSGKLYFYQETGNAITANVSASFSNGIAFYTNNHTMSVATGATLTLSGVISTASSPTGLTKTGAGTLTLMATNTYSGATAVNGGTLLVNGSLAPGSAVSVSNTGTVLGGTGTINGAVTVNAGATLQGGTGAATGTLTLGGGVALASDSIIRLALGATATAHSTLARTGSGAWTFDTNQQFSLIDAGAVVGTTYTGLITGLSGNPNTTGTWRLTNPGWAGSFLYNAGTNAIDFQLIAVPEPSTYGLLGAGAALALTAVRRRRKAR